ncbi:response regulator transcription factor [Sorangium sp. So ce1097]|uniref:response regulator transcription factor n=1 Tax=Sorangium sp. So ce1097 TaxID=3133330 RepID=UPI003F62CEBA
MADDGALGPENLQSTEKLHGIPAEPIQKPTTVFVVDDEDWVLRALRRLLRAAGYGVETFSSPRQFLGSVTRERAGCVVLDLRMPEVSGLETQEALGQLGCALSVVFITGHSDVPASVKAMKAGAVDVLIKPFDAHELLAAVERAVARSRAAQGARAEHEALRARFAALTPREREVCEHVAMGKPNKVIAVELGTVEKTIKVHRARVMEKLGVESLAELVRLVDRMQQS